MTKATQAQRRAYALDFETANPVLANGEFAFELDTKRFKVGDGTTPWNSIVCPYIPAGVISAKGDILVYGPSPVDNLSNPAFVQDANNDGVADGWTFSGIAGQATLVSGGQNLRSNTAQTAKISRVLQILPFHTYHIFGQYTFTTVGPGAGKLVISIEFFDDVELAVSTGINVFDVDSGTPGSPQDWSILDTSNITSHYMRISISVSNGSAATFSKITMLDKSNEATARLGIGNQGDILSRDEDGYLVWDNQAQDLTPYILGTDMIATYKTKAAAVAAHALFEQATDAAATYETQNNAAIAHALHQYAAAAATDYHTPASLLAALFEPIDLAVVKTADQTVTNSAAYLSDTQLLFPMVANGIYLFELFLLVTGTTSNGMRISMLAPTSASNIWGVHAPAPGAGVTSGLVHQAVSTSTGATPGTQSIGLDGTTPLFVTCRGTIFNGTTAGNMTLSFAQNVAAASTSCTIKADSYLRAVRIG